MLLQNTDGHFIVLTNPFFLSGKRNGKSRTGARIEIFFYQTVESCWAWLASWPIRERVNNYSSQWKHDGSCVERRSMLCNKGRRSIENVYSVRWWKREYKKIDGACPSLERNKNNKVLDDRHKFKFSNLCTIITSAQSFFTQSRTPPISWNGSVPVLVGERK